MKTPPLLLAATLLFWGWQTDFLLWAGVMAILLESSRLIHFRLSFSDTDLNRIWDLCGLLFAGAYVIIRNSVDIRLPAFVFPQWLPFVFFPMMLAQAFGTADSISMKTFSWLLRWRKAESKWSGRRINFSYLYFAICIFGASTTNKFSAIVIEKNFNWFFVCLALLITWALFAVRPKRVPLPLWICMMLMIAGTGFIAQQSLHEAQSRIETTLGSLIIRLLGRRHSDPTEGRTAIGRIGRLKLSGRIVLRVEPINKKSAPDLLREVTYGSYKNESWFAHHANYSELSLGKNESWTLVSKKADLGATIYGNLDKNSAIVPLPLGTAEITNLPAAVKMNSYGTVKAEEIAGPFAYYVNYGPGATADSPPGDADINDVPEREKEALVKIAEQLELDSSTKTDRQKLHSIAQFFENKFSYSTFISDEHVDRSGRKSPLSLFLERTHSGHCEYFATATVLLARVAKIPARYATGYSVQESSKSGDLFIVRERHAHAWALVWDREKGCWENFDTTPASWDKIEEQNASFFEPLSDAWSRLVFEFSKWRYGKANYQQYLIWALIPLVVILVWRIVFNKERQRRQKVGPTTIKTDWPGLDSEFYLIEKCLAELGLARPQEESLLHWKTRIRTATPYFNRQLEDILTLHHRYRFDPEGISKGDREQLAKNVRDWLAMVAKAKKDAVPTH